MTALLALDIGSSLGFATYSLNFNVERYTWGSYDLKSGEHPGTRMADLRHWLTGMKAGLGGEVDFVIWEDAFRQPGKANAIHHRLVGAMLAWACHHGIGVLPVNPTHVKTFATGNPRADKPAMIAAAIRAGFSIDTNDHDAADALHVLRFAMAHNNHLGEVA